MDEATVINMFNLCWSAVLKESELNNYTFFTEGHCKILDSRDTDFNQVENRLAYAYKFGYFNAQYVEKCISNFFTEYSGPETDFPVENLKICSLSNGPGLDIVGFLCALCKSKKILRCFPYLKSVNLYDSWQTMYKSVVTMACESIRLKSNDEYFNIPSENIHLIQSDIYNTISSEAEKVINDSNVLLMVKIFVSTKATAGVFTLTLKKIFSLLKPGTLIFFIGTKHNIRNFSQDASLSCPVKCIYGPQKVTLKDLFLKDDNVNNLAVKPQDSGYGYFIVWQKRDVDAPLEFIKNKKKRTRRKKKKVVTVQNQKDGNAITDEVLDDNDAESEASFTSCSKQSDSLSDEMNVQNSESIDYFISSSECSINNITSIFDKVDTSSLELQAKELLSMNDNGIYNLKNCIQEKNPEPVGNLTGTPPLQDACSKKASVEQIQNVETTQNKISHNVMPQVVNEFDSGAKIDLYDLNTEKNIIDVFYQTTFQQDIQNKGCKEPNTSSKKASKKKKLAAAFSSDANDGIRNDKSMPETTLQANLSINQSPENICNFSSVINTQNSSVEINGRNSSDIQRLIQRCENLLSSLEEITDDMKRDISTRNGQCFIKKCCCTSTRCYRLGDPCCCSYGTDIQLYRCRQTCNCNMTRSIGTFCSTSLPCGNNRVTCDCCFDTRRQGCR